MHRESWRNTRNCEETQKRPLVRTKHGVRDLAPAAISSHLRGRRLEHPLAMDAEPLHPGFAEYWAGSRRH